MSRRPLLAAVMAVIFGSLAWGYTLITDSNGYVNTWMGSTIPMQVKLSTTANLMDGSSQSSSVVAAMNAWNAQLGVVQFSAQELGPGAYGINNNVNEIVMDSTIGGDAFDSNTLAVTVSYTLGNDRVESDIVFNTAWTWNSYRGNLQAPEDIRRVAIHELGHVLGLGHPDQAGQSVTAIMNSTASNIDSLQADDISGGQALYGAPGSPPSNDHFANAATINVVNNFGQATGNSIGSSAEGGEPANAGEPATRTVWWKWTAPSNGSVTVTTAGSNFDTVLGVYTGGSVSNLTSLGSNDDATQGTRTSSVSFTATGGTTYYFAVDGWGGYFGQITIALNFSPAVVSVGPSIGANPSSQSIIAGQNVSFSVSAAGTAPLSFQWQRLPGGLGTWVNLVDGGNYSGALTSTLSVSGTTTAMTGDQFRCLVSNAVGSVTSASAVLTVTVANRAPEISFTLSSERAIGQTISISLNLGDPDGNFSYANLFVDTPGRGTLAIKADNSIVSSSAFLESHAVSVASGRHTRTFTFTPTDAVGNYTFRLAAVDTAGLRTDALPQVVNVVAAAPASFSLPSSIIDLSVPAGVDHYPLFIPVTRDAGVPNTGFTTAADVSWMQPVYSELDSTLIIPLSTAGLVAATNTATVRLMRGSEVVYLVVRVSVAQPNIIALLDDPIRSRVYGLHQAGSTGNGAVVVFDPINSSVRGAVTVGQQPGAFAIRSDGSELAVLCAASKSIVTINTSNLRVANTYSVADHYENTRTTMTTGRIRYGRGGIIYYVDGAWAPSMHVFDRGTGTVIQSLVMNGGAPQNTGVFGFGDFAVSPDGGKIFAWGQYGWDAGYANSQVGRLRVQADGTLISEELGQMLTYYYGWGRDPLDTPVLITGEGGKVFIKAGMFDPADIRAPRLSFPAPIYAISPGGEIAATSTGIYSAVTGDKIYDLGASRDRNVQIVTSDYSRLVYFDATARALRTIDLNQTIGAASMGLATQPAAGSAVVDPLELRWMPVPGFDRYRVYLGTSAGLVAGATPTSAEFCGEVTGNRYTLPTRLATGGSYYWRVDAVDDTRVIPGSVTGFTVSSISMNTRLIGSATVKGHSRQVARLQLTPLVGPTTAWTVSSPDSWISFSAEAGNTATELEVRMDSRSLPIGVSRGTVLVTTPEGVVTIPVELRVDPLAITRMQAAPDSTKVYAVSEAAATTSVPDGATRAYLLEYDTLMKRIDRVVPVNSNATDLAVHPADGRVYVTNWKAKQLVAVDRTSFSVVRTYDQPMNDSYSRDLYRISAGSAGRLLVEPMDQWVRIYLFDTVAGTAGASVFVGAGGGAYDRDGRYYFHGEGNSSGAVLMKFDTSGTTISEVARTGIKILSGYGSRNVVISGQGNRVFWNGGVYSSADLSLEWSTLSEVLASSSDGRYGLTSTAVFDVNNHQQVASLPVSVTAAAFNADTGRFAFQNGTDLDVLSLPGADTPGYSRTPADGTIVSPLNRLEWTALNGASGYRVYLGSDAASVANATPASPQYLGEVTGSAIDLPSLLAVGSTYYWRVDILIGGEVAVGSVQTFTISDLTPNLTSIRAITVSGHGDHATYIDLTSTTPGMAWTVNTTAAGWVRFDRSSGTTPASLRVSLDARQLPIGVSESSLTLRSGSNVVTIPIHFTVEPLAIVAFDSDPNSARVYAVSENAPGVGSRAFLLEIDSANERITRVVEAGSSATDVAWHAGDNRVYVTNWRLGNLLGFNPDSLRREVNFAVPAGYNSSDAYSIAAGPPGRLLLEAFDQWIYMTLFDTVAGRSLGQYNTHQGGGAYAPDRRYYYHGESNISNASLQKFDTAGDTFSRLGSVRVESFNYYGARTVTVSADGSRVFWNGGMFDANLNVLWTFGSEVFSTSADGRYAFGLEKVFDTVEKRQIYSLPNSSNVRAYNIATGKLLFQNGDRLWFYPLAALPAVGTPPSIVQQPRDAANVGSAMSFTVEVFGSAPFAYQWQRRAAGSANWSTIYNYQPFEGTTTATLRVNPVTTAMTGDRYRCLISNAHGSVTTAEAEVRTAVPPIITVQPQPRAVLLGMPATFSVAVSSAIPVDYQWRKNGAVIGATNSPEYSIPNVQLEDLGDYSVVVTSASGSVTSNAATLALAVPPVISLGPSSQVGYEGAPVVFTVTVSSNAPLSYAWRKNGNAIHGATGATFAIPAASEADEGDYSVVVTNIAGSATSNAATLTVEPSFPPVITQQPANKIAPPGGSATFSVAATSPLAMTYAWQRTSPTAGTWQSIPTDSNYSGANTSTLTVSNATVAMDGAQYRCVVSNITGSTISSVAQLRVGDVAAAKISAGRYHSVRLDVAGRLIAAGINTYGQLGNGTTASTPSTAIIESVGLAPAAVAAGGQHSLQLMETGELFAVGFNGNGQLGDGTTVSKSIGVLMSTDVAAMAAAVFHTAYVKKDGTLWLVGGNDSGQLGDGTTTDRLTPVQVATSVVDVALGNRQTFFLKSDGTLWGMGDMNGSGTPVTTPVQIATQVKAVSAGAYHSLFVKQDGTLWAMGYNPYGQLGNGTTTTSNAPVQVATDVRAVAAGYFHSAFIKTDDTLWAMGYNSGGQLGDGTVTNRTLPIQVSFNVATVSANEAYTLFAKRDGSFWGTGYNAYGQFGNGGTATTMTPLQISPGILPLPASPKGLTGTSVESLDRVRLTWLPSADASTYEVWRNTSNDSASATLLAKDVRWGLFEDRSVVNGQGYYYWIKAVNGTGTSGFSAAVPASSSPAVAPVVTASPQSQTVNAGGNVTFSATVTGSAPMSYQWRKGEANLTDGAGISGATTTSLTITGVTVGHAGSYQLIASNPAGNATSTAAVLSVSAVAQTITFPTLANRAFTSDPITLSATANSGLAVTFTVVSGPATLNGSTLTLTGPGTVVIRATQAGNTTFAAADPVEQSFVVTANLASWRGGYFTAEELADAAISGPTADPDRDGLANLLEYALGLDPKAANQSGLPELTSTASDWTYTYTRPASRPDLTYTVERSTDLVTWTSDGVTHIRTVAGETTETWSATVPLSTGNNLFLRLKVVAP